ncbi:MAG: aldehyde dehydrogenase family protein, partial [Gaiellales bacterium]
MIDYAVTNPATGQQIKTYPTITDAELEAAIGLAHQTHQNWLRSTSVDERAKLVRRVGELHSERREQLAEITVREMGKPTEQALGEIDFCVDIYGYYADNGPALMKDEPIQLLAGQGSAIIRRSSLGVILGIMPWNFPTYQVARFAGPGLIIGNAVLLKHAPQCPETAEALQQIYLDAGFPEGAYVNIYATNDQIASVIADPRVQGVSVTGSERAGAAVAEIAGRNLKKVVLELGGSDPFIVLADADLEEAATMAARARFQNTGQSCIAAKRFLVEEAVAEAFEHRFAAAVEQLTVGNPMDRATQVGPLARDDLRTALDRQVQESVRQGAQVATGGHSLPGPGYFY